MSRENVERWRAAVEDFRACTSELGWEAWLDRNAAERWHPDIEWDASEAEQFGLLDLAGVYRGTEAVRRWWREWLAAWEVVEFDYDLVDAGDRIVLLIDQRMRGRSTGIEVPFGKYAQVATFRDGRIVHWKVYLSQSEALEAVGLRE
jgi:ketosteroid isomerase-like protein